MATPAKTVLGWTQAVGITIYEWCQQWTLQSNRRRQRPKNTWKRSGHQEKEMWTAGVRYRWTKVKACQ